MDYVKDIIPEGSEHPSRLTQSKKKTWGQEPGEAREECHFWPRDVSKMRWVNRGGLRGLFRNQGVLGFSCL
jgi:hypothetical protein